MTETSTATPERGRGSKKKKPFFSRIALFLRQMVAELRKVIWPTRRELITYTAVVIVFVAIMMVIIGLLDVAFTRLMFEVFGG